MLANENTADSRAKRKPDTVDVASVADSGLVADDTLSRFLELVLQAAALSSGKPARTLEESLQQLAAEDGCFARWIAICAVAACQWEDRIASEGSCPSLPSANRRHDIAGAQNNRVRTTDSQSHELASHETATQESLSQKTLAFDSDSLQALSAWLPESVVGHLPLLRSASESLHRMLSQACHLAVRVRATESSMASTQPRREIERIYQFAYGLSHELNNPLANISTRAGVLLQSDRLSHDERDLLRSIIDSAMRGSEMLGDLMLVARPPELQFQSLDPLVWLAECVADASRWTIGYALHLHLDAFFSGKIWADPNALREALWAVLRNAIEASVPGNRIEIAARNCRNGDLAITVQDEGSGLSLQALEHAFDPYYSGREAGRGLGLGLSKARRILELHRGKITLENAAQGGCRIKMVIPLER